MSKSLMLILTMAMLVWSLTACGCTAKQAGEQDQTSNNGQSDSAIIDDNGSGDSAANGGGAGNGESGSAANGGGAGSGESGSAANGGGIGSGESGSAGTGTGNALTGNSATGGVSYEQMLRNARVHDRDGDLTDHENSVSRSMF